MSDITISIVSHGHGEMVAGLLDQISAYCKRVRRVVLTHNVPEEIDLDRNKYLFEFVELYNEIPLGFGSNHNKAFAQCNTDYYCVMNPDVLLQEDPFIRLLECCQRVESRVGVIAPVVFDELGAVQDSARYFPRPQDLAKKIFNIYDGVFPVDCTKDYTCPDWVGGMFMLFHAEV